MGSYSISDLEKLSGIKAHTIRAWENRYGIVMPKRTSTNRRYYCDDDLKKLLNISILTKHGYKISKLANLPIQQLRDKVILLMREKGDYSTKIEQMLESMIDYDEKIFNKILSNSFLQLGFEETFTSIIFPFLEKIGILWQTGSITPAQEHFVSNVIRQKLIVAIDSMMEKTKKDPKHFLLFLPEGEYHELGLLFYYYMLKKMGHEVIYLGQSVPMPDVIEIASEHDVAYLFTCFISSIPENEAREAITFMADKFPEKSILVSGEQIRKVKFVPQNVIPIFTPNELRTLIDGYYLN